MANLGKWSGGVTALNPGTTWAAPNALFPTEDRNDSSVYGFTSSTSTLTAPSSGLPDGYLLIAAFEHQDTSNGRHNPQGQIVQLSGTGNFAGTPSSGYSRDNSEDRSYVRCWAFIDSPSASSTYQFQWKRDDDSPTGGTERSEFQVIPFFYSDIGIYSSTSTTQPGGTTPVVMTGFSGTDGTNITISSNVVSCTGDNKRYLILSGQSFEGGSGNTRTQRWHGLDIDGVQEDAAKGYSYMRNNSNDEIGEMVTWLVETTTPTVTIEQTCYRGDGISNLQGGADVDGATTATVGKHAMVVIELNDDAEVFRSRDTNQSALLATTGPIDLDANEATDFNDTASFTDLAVNSINCVKTNDYLFGANVACASNDVTNTTRWTAYSEFTVNGTEDSDSFAGDYMRNNQGTIDTFGWSANLLGFQAITAGDDVGVSVTELAGSEGGGAVVSPAGWTGFWGINLDTMEASGGGLPIPIMIHHVKHNIGS